MSMIDKYALRKFSCLVNPKDGYAIADCEDLRERRVLEFIVPEKPTWVTTTISNTIFGVLFGATQVSWEIVIHDIVGKLYLGWRRKNPLPSAIISFFSTIGLNALERERLLC